jgi:hypothetical protein
LKPCLHRGHAIRFLHVLHNVIKAHLEDGSSKKALDGLTRHAKARADHIFSWQVAARDWAALLKEVIAEQS